MSGAAALNTERKRLRDVFREKAREMAPSLLKSSSKPADSSSSKTANEAPKDDGNDAQEGRASGNNPAKPAADQAGS